MEGATSSCCMCGRHSAQPPRTRETGREEGRWTRGGEVLIPDLEQPSDHSPLATGSFYKPKKNSAGNLDSTGKPAQVPGSRTNCVTLGKALRSAELSPIRSVNWGLCRSLSTLPLCPTVLQPITPCPKQMSPKRKVIEIKF